MKKHYRHENDCLNCGAELQGKYCHSCGQENLQIKESFGHMITHAVADYFHFDHQFFHTLKPLLFSPGKLTNEYMAGRRVQYLHPVKMYIFISLVYFVLLFSGSNHETVKKSDVNKKVDTEMKDAAEAISNNPLLSEAQKKDILLKMNQRQRTDGQPDTLAYKKIKTHKGKDGKVDTTYVYEGFTVKKTAGGELDTTYTYDGLSDMVIASAEEETYEQYLKNQEKLPANKRDNIVEQYYNKKVYAWKERGGENTKKMIEEGVKHNAPKMMFLLLPLFALLLKISFYKNKKFYVEHLIFSFHFHCFMFLFLIIIMLLKKVTPESWSQIDSYLSAAGFFGVLWYLYRSLRVVYHRSVRRTISKTIGLFFSYLFALSLSLLLLLVITAIVEV